MAAYTNPLSSFCSAGLEVFDRRGPSPKPSSHHSACAGRDGRKPPDRQALAVYSAPADSVSGTQSRPRRGAARGVGVWIGASEAAGTSV
jgi:hypothetical protein